MEKVTNVKIRPDHEAVGSIFIALDDYKGYDFDADGVQILPDLVTVAAVSCYASGVDKEEFLRLSRAVADVIFNDDNDQLDLEEWLENEAKVSEEQG